MVRRVIDRDDDIAEAVFDIAAGDRQHWTSQDWRTVLADLSGCRLRLADWLDLNT